MSKLKKTIFVSLFAIVIIIFFWLKQNYQHSIATIGVWPITSKCTQKTGFVTALGLSPNGRYVITTDNTNHLVLWDLENKTKQILFCNANHLSARWIKGTRDFIWQNAANNVVSVQDVDGKVIKKIKLPFQITSHAMNTELEKYVVYNGLNIYLNYHNKIVKILASKKNNAINLATEALGSDYPMNFAFIKDGLITSIYSQYKQNNGIPAWNFSTLNVQREFRGLQGKTIEALSPDDQYLVGFGSESIFIYVWNVKANHKKFALADPLRGRLLSKNNSDNIKNWVWDNSKLISPPCEYCFLFSATVQILFVDKTHYILVSSFGILTLFDVNSPWPIKYLKLPTNDGVFLYSTFNHSMTSNPKTHLLIFSKYEKPGILVYRYNVQKKTIRKIDDIT